MYLTYILVDNNLRFSLEENAAWYDIIKMLITNITSYVFFIVIGK